MRFYIDRDDGHEIAGWLAPDNPNETPVVRAVLPDGTEHLISATVVRSDIRELGLHNSGQVGFVIDETIIAGLSTLDGVELYDDASDTLIYKRYRITRNQQKRLMFYDGSVFPQRHMIARIQPFFATSYDLVERMSYDTLANVLSSPYLASNVCIGRPLYLRYAYNLREANYIIAALLRDPYQDLAERLLFLNLLSRSETAPALMRYVEQYEILLPVVANLPSQDERTLRHSMRSLSLEQRRILSNPYTRMFGCNVGEEPNFRAVSVALETLASFDVVGTRDRFPAFAQLFNAFLEAPILSPQEPPEQYNAVDDLAVRLSRISAVTRMLEHDLALYSYVVEAVENGFAQA